MTMKTEQEQIEQIEKVLKDSVADYKHLKKKGVCYCYAETLIDHGYGDISEYKAEIERLKDSYARVQEQLRVQEQFAKYQIVSDKEIKAQRKQGQIDVLNELRERITKDRVANDTVVINANYEIKELIKEIENENETN